MDDSELELMEAWMRHGATREEAEGLVEGDVLAGIVFEGNHQTLRGYRAGVAATLRIGF